MFVDLCLINVFFADEFHVVNAVVFVAAFTLSVLVSPDSGIGLVVSICSGGWNGRCHARRGRRVGLERHVSDRKIPLGRGPLGQPVPVGSEHDGWCELELTKIICDKIRLSRDTSGSDDMSRHGSRMCVRQHNKITGEIRMTLRDCHHIEISFWGDFFHNVKLSPTQDSNLRP